MGDPTGNRMKQLKDDLARAEKDNLANPENDYDPTGFGMSTSRETAAKWAAAEQRRKELKEKMEKAKKDRLMQEKKAAAAAAAKKAAEAKAKSKPKAKPRAKSKPKENDPKESERAKSVTDTAGVGNVVHAAKDPPSEGSTAAESFDALQFEFDAPPDPLPSSSPTWLPCSMMSAPRAGV